MIVAVDEKNEGTCEGCYYDDSVAGCTHPDLCEGIGCGDRAIIFVEKEFTQKAAVRFRHLRRS